MPGVDVGVVGWVVGVDGDRMTGVRAIRRRALHPFTALRAVDQHRLSLIETVKPFEEVDAAQGDPLHRIACRARVRDFGEESRDLHPVSKIGWVGTTGLPAARNSSAIGS